MFQKKEEKLKMRVRQVSICWFEPVDGKQEVAESLVPLVRHRLTDLLSSPY